MAISPHIARLRAATVPSGTPEPDGDEVVTVGWFGRTDLSTVKLNGFAAAVLRATGYPPHRTRGRLTMGGQLPSESGNGPSLGRVARNGEAVIAPCSHTTPM